MRKAVLTLVLGVSVSCGGGNGSRSSTPQTPTQPTPPPPANTWSVAGRLVDTAGHEPISGATIAPSWDLPAVQSGSDGTYQIATVASPPTNPYKLSVSGPDLLTRELWVSWQRGPRVDVTIDAIRVRPPFNAEFYRQFVRGTYDQEGAPYANLRWMEPPRIYLQTVDQNNRPIEPEVLAVVREALARGVSEFSANRLSAAALESGAEARPDTPGWIKVNIVRDRDSDICGRATVGASPGTITLYHDLCSCGSNKIPAELVLHEVGHAMGFFHVPDRGSVMHPTDPVSCGPSQLTPAEKYHAAIAYSRPRGNRDPDSDPSNGAFVTPSTAIIVVESRVSR